MCIMWKDLFPCTLPHSHATNTKHTASPFRLPGYTLKTVNAIMKDWDIRKLKVEVESGPQWKSCVANTLPFSNIPLAHNHL